MSFYKAYENNEDMTYITYIEFYIPDDFDGIEALKNKAYQEIKKDKVTQVLIDFHLEKNQFQTITNFSYFLKHIFEEYKELEELHLNNSYYLEVNNKLKALGDLVEDYKKNKTIYLPKLKEFSVQLGGNTSSRDDIMFYIENYFGSGFLKHVEYITIHEKNGMVDSFYNYKEALLRLIQLKDNIHNLDSFGDDLESGVFQTILEDSEG